MWRTVAGCHDSWQDASMPASSDEDLSTATAARILSVHPDTLTRWAENGKVPHWITPGGQRRYRRADIDAIRTPVEPTTRGRAAS